jgi:hypothetical protein
VLIETGETARRRRPSRQGLRRTKYLDTWLTGTSEQQKPRYLLFINN